VVLGRVRHPETVRNLSVLLNVREIQPTVTTADKN
jgi:hypothetical protein